MRKESGIELVHVVVIANVIVIIVIIVVVVVTGFLYFLLPCDQK